MARNEAVGMYADTDVQASHSAQKQHTHTHTLPMKSTLLGRASTQMQSKPCCGDLLHNETDTSDKKTPHPPTRLQLYIQNRLRPSRTADHSALSCLHHILELEEGIVRCLCIPM